MELKCLLRTMRYRSVGCNEVHTELQFNFPDKFVKCFYKVTACAIYWVKYNMERDIYISVSEQGVGLTSRGTAAACLTAKYFTLHNIISLLDLGYSRRTP